MNIRTSIKNSTRLNRKWHQGSSVFKPKNATTLICCDITSVAGIQKTLDCLREDRNALKLHVEGLLLSKDDQKIFAMEEFLIQTSTEMMVIPEDKELKQAAVKPWKSITFLDDVSSRGRYVDYASEKKRFVKTLNEYCDIDKRSRVCLPLRFRVRVQLHPPMDVFSIIQLFQEIVRDPTVQEVEFPAFLQESLFAGPDEAAKAFSSFIDDSTLRWLGPSIALHISYNDNSVEKTPPTQQEDKKELSCTHLGRKDQFVRGRSKYNSATVALLKECATNLEKMTMKQYHRSCRGNGSINSLSVLSSTNSRMASIGFDNSDW